MEMQININDPFTLTKTETDYETKTDKNLQYQMASVSRQYEQLPKII